MKSHTRLILGFVFRFGVIYGLLIVPWPGWNDLYGRYFEALGQTVFSREDERREIVFEPHPLQHGFTSLTSQIKISNRNPNLVKGKIRAEMVGLDTRSIGWVPTALTTALILATPIPWPRRLRALLTGLILIHVFILFSLQACIWNKSADLSIITLSPFWKYLADGLDYTLMTQLGASFSVPVIIWILVTFRRQDTALGG